MQIPSTPSMIGLQDIDAPMELISKLTAERLLYAALVLLATWLVLRGSDAALKSLSRRVPRARFFFKSLSPLLRFGLWPLSGVIVVSIFAPSHQTLLAVLASTGIALGLGAQDLIKNIIGGVVILTDRPYQLGDRVKIGEAYGEVTHIGLRSTKITTPDDTVVTIPNSAILTGKAWNANSGVPDSLVVTELFVPHDVDPSEVIDLGYEVAYSSPYIRLSRPISVLLQDRFQDGPFTTVRIKAYVYDHREETRMQSDITTRAKAEFIRRGILLRWSRHDHKPSSAALRTNRRNEGDDLPRIAEEEVSADTSVAKVY